MHITLIVLFFFYNIDFTYLYLQLGRRYYYQQYLTRGSWLDAERKCNSMDIPKSHVWSINSYSEWWNVFHRMGIEFYDPRRTNKIFKLQDEVLLSTLSFIGLQRYNQVRRLVTAGRTQ